MPADFKAVRYEVAIVRFANDRYPNWVNAFQRNPAKVVEFVKNKYPKLRHFSNVNAFDIFTILSNAAEKVDPGNYKTNTAYKIIFVQKLIFISEIWSISQELSFDDPDPRQSSAVDDIPVLAFERGFEAERLASAERSVENALRDELPSDDSVFQSDSGLDISRSFENAMAAQLQEILADFEFPNEEPDFPILLEENQPMDGFDFIHMPFNDDANEENFENDQFAVMPDFPEDFPDLF